MTLAEIRKLFVDHSGRYDLVTEDYEDNGSDFFIKEGQRFLDRQLDISSLRIAKEYELQERDFKIALNEFRSVDSVVVKDDNRHLRLKRVSVNDLRKSFQVVGDHQKVDAGLPTRYALGFRDSPDETDDVRNLIIMPPAKQGLFLVVTGLAYTDPLEEEEDTNFWSLEHPMTLVQAVMFCLERFYRNREGMQDHLQAIELDLQGLQHDAVEEESTDQDQMRNSW